MLGCICICKADLNNAISKAVYLSHTALLSMDLLTYSHVADMLSSRSNGQIRVLWQVSQGLAEAGKIEWPGLPLSSAVSTCSWL